MTDESLHIFDPRRNFQLQGFSGRGATTTLHDASATGVSVSGIFQAAEDFAVLGLYNAYDYFNHLRVKHLPRTDLSGLTLAFDIEYDHALDGAMRLDAAKYPSVSWDAITFECGVGGPANTYEVRLLDHATVVSGGETPATATLRISGDENLDGGIDWLHLYFRDTRYTVTSTDARVETQLTADVAAGGIALQVLSADGFFTSDTIWLERTGTNEEQTTVIGAGGTSINASVTIDHPAGSFVTRKTRAWHIAEALAAIINTEGASVAGRFGPDQSGVVHADAYGGAGGTATLVLTFVTAAGASSRYGKLGNLDRVFVAHGRTLAGVEVMFGQGFQWTDGSGSSVRFAGGDNDTKYHVSLDFAALTDKLLRAVPMNDCRKIYMVFAPRFEASEMELEDGCFLAADVAEGDAVWAVGDTASLSGGRYFIGDAANEERVLLTEAVAGQVTVVRGYEGTTPLPFAAGARMSKLPPKSGFASDVEWRATMSNLAVVGDASLKAGGAAARIEESDSRCRYTGYWENYAYAGGFPSQWWSGGHAKRTAPSNGGDVRKVAFSYSQTAQHDLYLGTFLYTNCGKVSVSIDGVATTHDLYLDEYGGTTALVKVRGNVAAGNHTVEITALFDKNAASSGYYFYFDHLWPLVPQDAPDAPREYTDVSLAIDFDTDHGYKKPPAWHLWQLQRLGFKGHADVYMGVFWNNKRQRTGATYPYATVAFTGQPSPGEVASISIGGTTISHAIGYGETLQSIASHFRAAINGMFSGVWADDNYGTSTTLRIQSKAPGYTFTGVAVTNPVSGLMTLTLTDNLGSAGDEGDWELLDAVSPVMTEGARSWIRDLAGQFAAAGIGASFAFSMEAYNPPDAMRAKYLSHTGLVGAGADVFLEVPSYQMHFGTRVRNYLRQMYKECADEIAAAGLPVVLQFGETQYWYFDNRAQDPNGGMPFYDQETIDDFALAKGHQIWPFVSNTDDPAGDPAHPKETADFLRDRVWAYCQDVISYVRAYHPAAVFECLWPLDANQGKPSPSTDYRRLLMHVNLPDQWKTSSYGIKYFRCEGFDYDVWQKNATLMRQTIGYAATLGRPATECMYLAGLYGPPDPPMAQAYGLWLQAKLYSMCFWAFDQFCLNGRAVPLEAWVQSAAPATVYHKPNIARAAEVATAVDVVAPAGGALNRFQLNEARLNNV